MGSADPHRHPRIGVSPAYFISRYGDRFNPRQVAAAMGDIAALGCAGFQLEVYHAETLDRWVGQGARQVRQRSRDAGLDATQFVAHFMMEAFSSAVHLSNDDDIAQMSQVLEIVSDFDECRVVTLPLGSFESPVPVTFNDHQWLMERCVTKLERLLEMVEDAGRRLALEIMPGGLIAGTDGFLRLCERLGSPALALNLDTGHAWAAKENIYLLPAKIGTRIAGTHICDNLGHENLSLRPGVGSIDWPRMIDALKSAGYSGSFDLEIICPAQDVPAEYGAGIEVLDKLLQPDAAAA